MPLLDLPLAELQTYEGRNERPDDFGAYWARGLAELGEIPANVSLTPGPYTYRNAEAFDLFFDGTRGGRIYAKYLRPKGGTSLPTLLFFHGYTWRSEDWSSLLGWVGEGYAVAALDCRGQAGRSNDTTVTTGNTHNGLIIRGVDDAPDDLYFRQVFLDTVRLAEVVAGFEEVDAARIGALGGSQGGGLTLACAALSPLIRRCAPTFPFLCDYRRVWEMDQGGSAYAELKAWFRMRDPRHLREAEFFTRLGYIDNQHLASRINAETLLSVGLMDATCPPSTQFAAYNRIAGAKRLLIYPDYGHEGLHGQGDELHEFFSKL
ncbi:acetylxylan esterase [bacterium]|nr:MAG: acetylxylan esterase [bacterium]